MSVSRRTVLRAGAASAVALSAGGCATVAPKAARLLKTIIGLFTEGAGLELGASLVRNAPDVVKLAAAELPGDKGEQVASVYGYASEFVTATDPTAELGVAIAANYVDDDVLSSWAVHNNDTGFVRLPAIISLGLGRFSIARRDSLLAQWGKDRLAEVHRRVRTEMSVNVYERMDSDEEPGLITEPAVYRVSTFVDRNIEIEWAPNERRTEQCRLTIREGVVLAGRAPDWKYRQHFAIAPYQIWDDAPKPGE